MDSDGGSAAGDLGEIGPGDRVGDYIIVEQLARGGFGTIWRADHLRSARSVALKVLHAELLDSEETVKRFEREAETVAALRHANIVELYAHSSLPDGRPYLVMELLPGVDLDRHLGTGGLRPAQAYDIIRALCDALAYAHDSGVVHRDVKASNVRLCPREGGHRVVLLDFGVAKLLEDKGPALTASRHVLGTPACMAPEQIRGDPVDARTDVYALGALAYQLLTGERAFAEASDVTIHYMHLHARRPRPSARVDVPPALDELVARAMARSPDDRFPSARALADAFRAALAIEPAGGAAAGRAAAVHIELKAEGDALDDPDDALLDELEELLGVASELLEAQGFAVVDETVCSCLLARPVDVPGDDRAARAELVDLGLEVFRALDRRSEGGARVHANVGLHVAAADIDGGEITGGPVLELASWAPAGRLRGVYAPDALFAGLGTAIRPIAAKTEPSLVVALAEPG